MMSQDNRIAAKHLYRILYRLARRFDKNPERKVFLYLDPTKPEVKSLYNHADTYYRNTIRDLFNDSYFLTSDNDLPSFVSELNKEYRRIPPTTDDGETIDARLDAGYALYRNFNKAYTKSQAITSSASGLIKHVSLDRHFEFSPVGVTSPSQDASDRNSDLSDFPTHYSRVPFQETQKIEVGSVLVSHPLLKLPIPRSVVLILQITDNSIYGVIINRVTDFTFSEAVFNHPYENWLPYIEDNFVSCGGPIKRMTVIHPFKDIGEIDVENSQGLYASVKSVENTEKFLSKYANTKRGKQMIFYVGCCIWKPEDLIKEIAQGRWILGVSSPSLLIQMANGMMDAKNKRRSTPNALGRVDPYPFLIHAMGKKFQSLLQFPLSYFTYPIDSCDWPTI